MQTLQEITRNPLKEKLSRGEVAVSMIVRMARGPEIGRIAAIAGFDTLYVDLEHSALSLETTAVICNAAREAGVVPLVRVPDTSPSTICRILDAGAMGIVVPHVQSAENARHAVACALYPPRGERSTSSGLAMLHYRNFPQAEANAAINKSVFIAVMIESRAALECIEEIAAVPGIDMLFVGAGDLSADLGLPGQPTHPDVADGISKVLHAARKHGITAGLGGLAGRQTFLAEWMGKGVQFISAGTDLGFLAKAATDSVESIRAACKP
ncbi:MAG: aldolase/citrate lyase family protein [Pseudomonadota bacterium]